MFDCVCFACIQKYRCSFSSQSSRTSRHMLDNLRGHRNACIVSKSNPIIENRTCLLLKFFELFQFLLPKTQSVCQTIPPTDHVIVFKAPDAKMGTSMTFRACCFRRDSPQQRSASVSNYVEQFGASSCCEDPVNSGDSTSPRECVCVMLPSIDIGVNGE